MLSDDGAKIVRVILKELEDGTRTLPAEISLKHLESETGVRVQNIGMAFDTYINKPLAAKGILARKCGSPVRIQLESKNT
ncbi:hypothetical protein [Zobellella sp. An-6]|uniref:hypothetical protein n=1 Tax=Zobellella sp. An-6 TaxID=3400218 RepID=UPI004041A90E